MLICDQGRERRLGSQIKRRFTPPSSCCSYEAARPPSWMSCQGSQQNDAFSPMLFLPRPCLPCTDLEVCCLTVQIRKCECAFCDVLLLFRFPVECRQKCSPLEMRTTLASNELLTPLRCEKRRWETVIVRFIAGCYSLYSVHLSLFLTRVMILSQFVL